MKNIKYFIISIIIVIIIIILMVFLYKNTSSKTLDIFDKINDELDYLDTSIISMINDLDNLNTTSLVTFNESSIESSENDDNSNEQEENIIKYSLMQESIISTNNTNIDWNKLEISAENLYNSWATITIDLNSQEVSKDNILMFNTNLDNLMMSLQKQDKTNSKICLANLYSTLPKYMEELHCDENAKNFRKVKANILFSYAILDTGNWQDINNFLAEAEVDLKKIMESGKLNSNLKQTTVDKAYVLLRELIKSSNEKNIDLFYVKYVNLILELEKI